VNKTQFVKSQRTQTPVHQLRAWKRHSYSSRALRKWTFLTHTPEPVGLIRLQISTPEFCAQLRGPNACTLITPSEVKTMKAKIGPDPIRKDDPSAARIKVCSSGTPIGVLLMDQTLFAGVGNIYRAEALFRAGIDPQTLGKD